MPDAARNLWFLLGTASLACVNGNGKADDADDTAEDPCPTYAQKYAECWGAQYLEMGEDFCNTYLDGTTAYYGPDCREIHEAVFVCLSTLACDEFLGERFAGECADEAEAFNSMCGGGLRTP